MLALAALLAAAPLAASAAETCAFKDQLDRPLEAEDCAYMDGLQAIIDELAATGHVKHKVTLDPVVLVLPDAFNVISQLDGTIAFTKRAVECLKDKPTATRVVLSHEVGHHKQMDDGAVDKVLASGDPAQRRRLEAQADDIGRELLSLTGHPRDFADGFKQEAECAGESLAEMHSDDGYPGTGARWRDGISHQTQLEIDRHREAMKQVQQRSRQILTGMPVFTAPAGVDTQAPVAWGAAQARAQRTGYEPGKKLEDFSDQGRR
jgi:hypothetical protein